MYLSTMRLLRLAFSSLSFRTARAILAVLAIAFSVSLVISVTSGFSSLRAAVGRHFDELMGSVDVEVTRNGERGVPQSLLDDVREDAAVSGAAGRLELESRYLDAAAKLEGHPSVALLSGISLPEDTDVGNLKMDEGGRWWTGRGGNVAVVDQEVARKLNATVGDELVIPGVGRQLRLRIMGIVRKPRIMAAIRQSIYMPLETLQEFTDSRGQLSRVLVSLKSPGEAAAFESRWSGRVSAIDPNLRVRSARASRAELAGNLRSMEVFSYLGGAISMAAAAFVMFSTLSMGVSERLRILAMLRAVGAVRWQIGAMVVFEATILAAAGILLGTPLGLLWIKLLTAWKADYFYAGLIPSWGGLVLACAGSFVAVLLASILPAFAAMRISPLEGMSLSGRVRRRGVLLVAAAAGLLLACIDSAVIFTSAVPRSASFWLHIIVGLPTLMIGLFLVAPAIVWAADKSLAPLLARLLRIRRELLSQQLSTAIWRAAGTAAALMVGLSVLVVLQTRARTILDGWRLPDHFPDLFIFAPSGLTDQQAKRLETVTGIRKDGVLGIGVGVAGLPSGFVSISGLAALPDATLFLGVDPAKAIRMMDLRFRQGNAQDAVRLLAEGRHILVTEEFRQVKGLGLGDKLRLKTSANGEVEYTVAGVVTSPGLDVFVVGFDMGRAFVNRSAGSVFGSMEDARKDFGVDRLSLFAANLEPAVDRNELEQRVRVSLGEWGLYCGNVREIKQHISDNVRNLLMLVSTLGMSAIALATLGVANTVMASVRTRRWQFGILRSVGLTRAQMLRLILAEGVLLGLVGSVLGVVGGYLLSVNDARLIFKLVGYRAPQAVPWAVVGIGVAITLSAALLASIWPALSASRQEPLRLLQAGRAAA